MRIDTEAGRMRPDYFSMPEQFVQSLRLNNETTSWSVFPVWLIIHNIESGVCK